jgi:hypothetical protein
VSVSVARHPCGLSPSEVGMSAVSQTSVAGAWQPLVESTVLQSLVCDGVPGLLGYPDPEPMPRRFRRTVVVFHRHRYPASCDAGCILSWTSFSFRVRRAITCSFACASERLPWGLVPHHDISAWSPVRRVPSDDVPSAAFRTLSTACSSSCLAHLFHCAAVSRVHASGVDFL